MSEGENQHAGIEGLRMDGDSSAVGFRELPAGQHREFRAGETGERSLCLLGP